METIVVSIDRIDIGTRYREDLGDLSEIEASIREHGIISPLAVEKTESGYTLLAGGRRLQASKNVGLVEVPVRIYTNLDDYTRRSIELEENIRRKDMTWQEEVTLKRKVHELRQQIHGTACPSRLNSGWGLADTAELLQESIGGISQDIKLAKALESVPGIKDKKTKKEAQAALKKLERQLSVEHKAQKFDSQEGDSPLLKLSKSYILGDCIEQMKQLGENHFSIVEIDPPYGIDYDRIAKTVGQSIEREDYKEVASSDYISFILQLMTQAKRVVKPNGWIILWMPNIWFDLVRSICTTLQLYTTTPALWIKHQMPGSTLNPKYILGNNYETFFYIRKSSEATIHRQGRRNIFLYDPPTVDRIHPTERPIDLIVDILTTFGQPLDLVLSPFLGSGNTLLAAHKAKMIPLGFDISEPYRNAFLERLSRMHREEKNSSI